MRPTARGAHRAIGPSTSLCFLLGIGFTALVFVDGADRRLPTVPVAVDAALGVLASLGLWLRRRWPVGLAVIVGLFAIYSVSASAVALIALFTVAVHRRLRTAVLVAAGYALTSFLTLLVRSDMSPPNWWQAVLGVVCVVAVLALGMFVRARRQLALVERERAASEQEIRVAEARQMERNRISREMHDVLAHRLSLLSLQAGALELWPEAPPAEIARAAGVIRGNAHGALEDLREVIGVLRSARRQPCRACSARTAIAMILARAPHRGGGGGRRGRGAHRGRQVRAGRVLMDIRMPRVDGLAATELLRARPHPPEIIVLTTFDADAYVLRALRAGPVVSCSRTLRLRRSCGQCA